MDKAGTLKDEMRNKQDEIKIGERILNGKMENLKLYSCI